MSSEKEERWIELYQKYSESVINPSNLYLPPADSQDEPDTEK